jgi:hypothetical protein
VRRAARVDENQSELVKAAEQLGCTVLLLHQVGGGCPDILIGQASRFGRRNILVEIKTGAGDLTPEQIRFRREWRGQVVICRSVAELLAVLRAPF